MLPAVTIRDYQQGQEISAQPMVNYGYWGGGSITDLVFSIPERSVALELLGIEAFPATQLWSNDEGQALIETKAGNLHGLVVGGDLYMVQTIDLEYLEQNDAWIDKHYNPVCLSCWYWTCQTILKEGDTLGEAYSVRLVAEEECEAVFHENDHEEEQFSYA